MISGGEPTLHPHFRTLLDYVGKAKLRLVEVYTNATGSPTTSSAA